MKGLDWYKNLIPTIGTTDLYKVIGEITSVYLYGNAPKFISKLLPQVKFIVIIRYPTEGVYSDIYCINAILVLMTFLMNI